jgi:Cytochrome bd terminal oxidase subunit I
MTRWFLLPAAVAGLAAIIALEAGWIVTEVGRQPWVVYGYLLTKDAVTPSAGVPVMLGVVLVLYKILTAVVIGVPALMARRWRHEDPRRRVARGRGDGAGALVRANHHPAGQVVQDRQHPGRLSHRPDRLPGRHARCPRRPVAHVMSLAPASSRCSPKSRAGCAGPGRRWPPGLPCSDGGPAPPVRPSGGGGAGHRPATACG